MQTITTKLTGMSGTNKLQFLTENDWVLLRSKAEELTFRLGEVIVQEGSVGDAIYVIRSGSASVELAVGKRDIKIANLGPDDICGDMAFLERGQSTATVIAKDEIVEVDRLLAADLREMFDAFPGLGLRFYQSLAVVLARRLRQTSRDLARQRQATGR
jgi:CRP-like cAMP-binding protein